MPYVDPDANSAFHFGGAFVCLDLLTLCIAVTQKGLLQLMNIVVPLIVKEFQHLHLPKCTIARYVVSCLRSVHLDEEVPVVGHITLDVTNIIVQSFATPHPIVKMGAPATLLLEFTGVTFLITADWYVMAPAALLSCS